jgi:hypothetical protein
MRRVSRRVLGTQLPTESGEKKERNCETTSYAKILGERASLHDIPWL